jgi:hypothetical protein
MSRRSLVIGASLTRATTCTAAGLAEAVPCEATGFWAEAASIQATTARARSSNRMAVT